MANTGAIHGFDGDYTPPLKALLPGEKLKFKLPDPKTENKSPLLSKCGRITALPKEFFGDPQWMLFLVLFFGVATQAFALIGGPAATYIPYLSIASSPLYLIHAMRSTIKNFKMMSEAAKTKQTGEAIFYVIMGLSALGTAFGDITKPFAGGIEIAGLSSQMTCALIFGKILPIIMVATGTISGIAALAQLWRAQAELKKLESKLKNPTFRKLIESLELIKTKKTSEIDEAKRKEFFESNHSHRQKLIEEKLNGHQFNFSCPIKSVIHPHHSQVFSENPNDLLHQTKSLLAAVVNDQATVDGLKALINAIEITMDEHAALFVGEEAEAFKRALQEQKAEIDKLEERSLELLDEVRAELHRKIATHAIMLFLAVLTVVGGLISRTSLPHHQMVSAILVITGCTAGMANILFGKFVTHNQYLKMDKWLFSALPKSA